jgi:nickel-dependent lactate racemase
MGSETIELKYGEEMIAFDLPGERLLGILKPGSAPAPTSEEAEVRRALAHPVGSLRIREIVKPGERIAIVTSDITRPVPSYKILPPLLDELADAGVATEDITIVLALGSHRSHTEEEKQKLVGDTVTARGIRVIDSDMTQCVRLGQCRNGTPVDIFRPVAEADRRICLGNIEYHYFAGYSGGSKALMPGVSSHEAIQANHANMIREGAYAGNIEGNPVREDIEQITDFIHIDFIVNVVLDDAKHILKAVAGDVVKAHREGCAFLDKIYKVPIERKADIVILSPGGFPKDINLYQSQKGLDNAKHAVKDGGILVWCASAREGFGEAVFEEWMRTMAPNEMIEEIRRNFKLGGHKAAAIGMVLKKTRIFFVSDLDDALVREIGFEPFPDVRQAVRAALEICGESAGVYVMPAANSTLPAWAG